MQERASLGSKFQRVIKDLTEPEKAEKLTKNLIKTPKTMTLKEKLTYYKKKVTAEIKSKDKVKTPTPKKAIAKMKRGYRWLQNRKKRRFLPYLIVGLILCYVVHWLVKLYDIAPATEGVTFIDNARLDWMMENWTSKSFIDFHFTQASLYGGGLALFVVLMFYFRVGDKGRLPLRGRNTGSARYATNKEIASFRDKEPENDMIFSQNGRMGLFNKRLPFNRQLNKNTLTVGLPADGKTFTFVKPNLMQMNSSFVITDPKGLLVRETGKMLEDHGYKIKVFDLVNLTNSNQFNVFHYMHDELDIDRVAEAIIAGTKRSDNTGEDFWNQAEMLLMRALIGYLYFDGKVLKKYEPNIAQVADLLRNIKKDDDEIPSVVRECLKNSKKNYQVTMLIGSGNCLIATLKAKQ